MKATALVVVFLVGLAAIATHAMLVRTYCVLNGKTAR